MNSMLKFISNYIHRISIFYPMNYYNVLDYYEISVIATVNKYYNNENIAVILNNIAKDYFTNILD